MLYSFVKAKLGFTFEIKGIYSFSDILPLSWQQKTELK